MKRRIDTTDDIEDSSHYSIEDAKQKAEQDRKLKAAEAKKQKVRHKDKNSNQSCYCVIFIILGPKGYYVATENIY